MSSTNHSRALSSLTKLAKAKLGIPLQRVHPPSFFKKTYRYYKSCMVLATIPNSPPYIKLCSTESDDDTEHKRMTHRAEIHNFFNWWQSCYCKTWIIYWSHYHTKRKKAGGKGYWITSRMYIQLRAYKLKSHQNNNICLQQISIIEYTKLKMKLPGSFFVCLSIHLQELKTYIISLKVFLVLVSSLFSSLFTPAARGHAGIWLL